MVRGLGGRVALTLYENQGCGDGPTGALAARQWTQGLRHRERALPTASLISYCYDLRIPLPYYAGGGFYWYFAEDKIPWRASPLWRVLAGAWSAVPCRGRHRS